MLVIDETALPKKGSHVSIGCSVAQRHSSLLQLMDDVLQIPQ